MRKPTRSISGVTPLAVVIKPRPCPHGKCVYCPTLGVPQSYTPDSPAIIRAKQLDYDPFKQVKSRLKILGLMKHPLDKIELIIIGGTFLAYPQQYQYNFVKSCYDAFNGRKAETLEQAKRINEKAKHRVVAFCVETRPDWAFEPHIRKMLEFGVTRCEIGVQAIDDKIYKLVKRGHNVKDVVKATQLLKDSGFKVGYHIMPGLPGSNPSKDIKMFKKIFSDEKFRPDQLKIYPTQVIKGSELEDWYYKGKYKPYTKEQLIKLLTKFEILTPRYVRIMRMMREIPKNWLVAGTININLRQEIEKIMRQQDIKTKEMRFREVGFAKRFMDVKKGTRIKTTKYKASKGTEFFIEAINGDGVIFGLIRLRFPYKPFISELKNSAIIRELHVYGSEVAIGKAGNSIQHKGLGKRLMQEAERIAKQHYDKVAVISGVGVRGYYERLGYSLGKWFMIKNL